MSLFIHSGLTYVFAFGFVGSILFFKSNRSRIKSLHDLDLIDPQLDPTDSRILFTRPGGFGVFIKGFQQKHEEKRATRRGESLNKGLQRATS